MTDEVKNLSSLYGFARLYATLIQDGGNRQQTMDMLYNCYCANVTAYNAQQGEQIIPVSQSVFYKMMTNQAEPYKTDIQTIKALTLLMWNTGAGPAMEAISNVQNDYAYRFYAETYYAYCDSVTSFSLCEDTLDPEHEPTMELNPALLMRKYDTGPKLVYISAPLRGDVEKNIAYAKEKAREVFKEGHIPICPHLIFPPIADPYNPEENKRAMKMCLKLLERCNELRVYGPEWTDGMWQEIRHAEQLKIPIRMDRQERQQAKHREQPCR